MTEPRKLPVPFKRFHDAYELTVREVKPFARWRRDANWDLAYKESSEDRLDEKRIRFIDMFNAFIYHSTCSEKEKAVYYRRAARSIFHVQDDAVVLWEKEIRKEYAVAAETDEPWSAFKYFHNFMKILDITRYSDDYHQDDYDTTYASNCIKLTGPKDRNGVPLIFNKRNVELLLPHFNLHDEMSARDLLEAEGILKLHEAWKTTNDDEKQKIKRFVAAHANDIDAAISIIESRFVNTLDQLESFMEQSGETSALMDGAL